MDNRTNERLPEPWLRGSLPDVPSVQRAILHALELAREDLEQWCGNLTDEEIDARPAGLPSIAFHLCHIARSLDRLLTYAEGRNLSDKQLAALKSEMDPGTTRNQLFAEVRSALAQSGERILRFDAARLEEPRVIGKKHLPTTLGGLLVHVADHTQRHVGQVITTVKVLMDARKK